MVVALSEDDDDEENGAIFCRFAAGGDGVSALVNAARSVFSTFFLPLFWPETAAMVGDEALTRSSSVHPPLLREALL